MLSARRRLTDQEALLSEDRQHSLPAGGNTDAHEGGASPASDSSLVDGSHDRNMHVKRRFRLPWLFTLLWGDLTLRELKKFAVLALVFHCLMASYWMLRPLKEGIFYDLVGIELLPVARVVSATCLTPVLLVYTKLVDHFPRQTLLYIICSAFASAFLVTAVVFAAFKLPRTYAANERPVLFVSLGWIVFVLIEVYGSIILSLFWSFVAVSTAADSAKKGYAIIVLGGQIGSIIGPLLATLAEYIGVPGLFLIGTAYTVTGMALVSFYMNTVERVVVHQGSSNHGRRGVTEPASTASARGAMTRSGGGAGGGGAGGGGGRRGEPSILRGFSLLLTTPYLIGVLLISTVFEVIGTIMDMQMKMLAKTHNPSNAEYTSFVASFGVATNLLSFVIAFLGTSSLMRHLGVRGCLLLFPTIVFTSLCVVLMYPNIVVVYTAQVVLKALAYSVNNPTKEVLYLPTSHDVKFKVKGAIDTVGARSAKAIGAVISGSLSTSMQYLMKFGSVTGLFFVVLWFTAVVYVSSNFERMSRERALSTDTGHEGHHRPPGSTSLGDLIADRRDEEEVDGEFLDDVLPTEDGGD